MKLLAIDRPELFQVVAGDRLLFDLLAREHRELDERRWRSHERAQRSAVCGTLQARTG